MPERPDRTLQDVQVGPLGCMGCSSRIELPSITQFHLSFSDEITYQSNRSPPGCLCCPGMLCFGQSEVKYLRLLHAICFFVI